MDTDDLSSEDFTVTCPICHGSMVEGELRVPGGDDKVYVELYGPSHPHQMLLIRTFVCSKCGYIQLVAVRDQKA